MRELIACRCVCTIIWVCCLVLAQLQTARNKMSKEDALESYAQAKSRFAYQITVHHVKFLVDLQAGDR